MLLDLLDRSFQFRLDSDIRLLQAEIVELDTALSVSKARLGCLQKMQAKRKHEEETENDPERAGEDHAGEDESESSRNRRARVVYDL